ncbi:DUF397 domain-containing protein [Streptacidiphilus albus]|uniref:DUF397 domain-containing protein n=1 Tax=Streptacidiphilus albus TaxID=105425 RepID=UPI00054C27F2|nr:DUF397 domain-containing protein [Streptacidiphilus albus]
MDTPEVVGTFVKSSYSAGQQNCVSVAPTADGGRAVRHTKDVEQATQVYTRDEWAAFIAGVKAGEFDV